MSHRRPALWSAYLAFGLAACAAYLFGPLKGAAPLMNLLGLSPVAAIVAGVLRHRPSARAAWLLLAAGSLVFFFGDVYTYGYSLVTHRDVPFPSVGDAFYLAMYPLMMAGLLLLVRRRSNGEDRGGLVDGLVLTVGLALPSWVALISPYLHQNDLGLAAKMVSVAYPMGDVILLGAVVRLALDAGRREASFWLLTSSIALLLVTDFIYGLLTLHDAFDRQLWLDVGWIGSYLLWGAAGLHPSMARLAEPAPRKETVLTRFRLGLLTLASLIAPLIAMLDGLGDKSLDSMIMQVSSIALFVLVLTRMAGLIGRQRRLSDELHRRQSEARFGALVSQASDLIVVLDPDGTVTYSSPSVERVLGRCLRDSLAEDADRERLEQALAAEEPHPFECTLIGADGEPRAFEFRLTNLTGTEHVGGILLNARDVSERKAFEAELTHQAFHDTLTGLANRPMFIEHTRQALARGRREGSTQAVLFLDLDDFKEINDSLGHAIGDEVLVAVAQRLDGAVRSVDTAARFGGDEFAILLEEIDGQGAADAAQRVLDLLAEPLSAGGRETTLHTSVGVAVAVAGDPRTAEELIRDADAAMYTAKRAGKGGYRLFEPAMHADVLDRLELRSDLERALEADELELHYQPVVRLDDGSISGFEALLRWRHPERGLVSPVDFIPIAEETGLIVPIGRWVLHEATRHACLLGDLRINVNLSAKQLQFPGIVDDVRAALDAAGLAPERLVLELTESVLLEDGEVAVERLHALKALGVRLALDDFGTGFSSLSYLSRLPVDILKLDRFFLRDGAPALTAGIVGLGAALQLAVVAEGIETEDQWYALQALGCDFGQGFFFSRPLDAAASLEYLAVSVGVR
jgi:diguanylate cyclase (GGDEF)-like protein/PAS domain S-box-containing protein